MYRLWATRLETVCVCPVRLPGRESRIDEPPFQEMRALVSVLLKAIRPYLDREFVFFGHSMGAGIAFELARALRRDALQMPSKLMVSSARAPHLRTGASGPEPSDEELVKQLTPLSALPENPSLLKLAMPALRADTRLYRQYRYTDEQPLNMPIHIYGGELDRSLTREQLDGWRQQTTAASALTMFPGGHFFFHESETLFLETLGRDLSI